MAYAVLGPRGTFSEEAAYQYWGNSVELCVAQNIPELFYMVENGYAEGALVPVENSLAGDIQLALQCLKSSCVKIAGEIAIPIQQHLMACKNYSLQEIELLISHPAALMQCKQFIEQNLGSVVRVESTDSTAMAAEMLCKVNERAACIGNMRAARLYGLEIIYHDIANNYNITRFIHISSNAAGHSNSIRAKKQPVQ